MEVELCGHTQWHRNEFETGRAPVRSKSGRHRCAVKNFFGSCPSTFWL